MKTTLPKLKKLNVLITNRIIELQHQGYLYDFTSVDKQRFLCLQDSLCFHTTDVSIKLIDQVYDQLSNSYKYIHAIETASGCKGLMLEEGIYIN